jgi:hypothetical protein
VSKKKSRADRWSEAVSRAREALQEAVEEADKLRLHIDELSACMADLRDIQEEFEEWQGNLPESLSSSPVAEKLEAVTSISIDTDLDLGDAIRLDEITSTLDDCEAADLPQGFGRD